MHSIQKCIDCYICTMKICIDYNILYQYSTDTLLRRWDWKNVLCAVSWVYFVHAVGCPWYIALGVPRLLCLVWSLTHCCPGGIGRYILYIYCVYIYK